jgi:hypothetical protein
MGQATLSPPTLYPILDFPDYYADALGNIWSDKRGTLKRLKPERTTHGGRKKTYLAVNLRKDGKTFHIEVQRLVLLAFAGACPPGHEACHENGDSLDNRACNLRWGTKKSNAADSLKHGTRAIGERNGQAKISDTKIPILRVRYAAGDITQQQLADECGISDSQISLIINGKRRAYN